jgi:hypothetical protein
LQKPKLLLSLLAHAPKVAIPAGRVYLVVDLGLFSLRTHNDAKVALKAEEAALFECFQLGVKNVSAHLVQVTLVYVSASYQA